jgi:nucleotide-binding universal stress UspA family protein
LTLATFTCEEKPMLHFKKILVPTDFSETSRQSLQLAADLSRRYDAELVLLHVFEPVTLMIPDGMEFFSTEQLDLIAAEITKSLQAAAAEAAAAGAVRVSTQQLRGPVAPQILDLASSSGFDLIVMGTHGRTGIQHALLGSVAEKVVRRAACPVLSVRVPSES